MTHIQFGNGHEPYLTIPAAACTLGVPTSTLRRAINAGLLPYHTPFSSRRRVLLSEVRAAMASYQKEASNG